MYMASAAGASPRAMIDGALVGQAGAQRGRDACAGAAASSASTPAASSEVRSGRSPAAPNRMISARRTRKDSRVRSSRSTSADSTSGRAAERARDAVEELERLVLGVLGEVRAVGEDEHRGGRDDQPAGGPVLGDQRRAGEPDARVGERDDEVGAEHAEHAAATAACPRRARSPSSTSAAATSEPASDGGERRAPHARGRSRPAPGPARAARSTASVAVSANWARLKATLTGELPRTKRSTSERPGDLGDDQVLRRGEQQADDERQLRERERVRAAAEVGVDDEDLGRPRRPRASAHHGTWKPSVYAGRSRATAEVQHHRRSRRSARRAARWPRCAGGRSSQLPSRHSSRSPTSASGPAAGPAAPRPPAARPAAAGPAVLPGPHGRRRAPGLLAQVRPQRLQVEHGGRNGCAASAALGVGSASVRAEVDPARRRPPTRPRPGRPRRP